MLKALKIITQVEGVGSESKWSQYSSTGEWRVDYYYYFSGEGI